MSANYDSGEVWSQALPTNQQCFPTSDCIRMPPTKMRGPVSLRIVQVLPELNSGGVERGTVEFARYLVANGHESIVISAGGSLVSSLSAQGSRHVTMPVQRKHLSSLLQVRPLRRLLDELAPDLIHVRSRIPAWLVWLAVGRRAVMDRPALVSTFHGLYSINRYSAIMGCGDAVIAISACVRDYIVQNYPKVNPDKLFLVHRGVDRGVFPADFTPTDDWLAQFDADFPGLRQKPLLLMPGRLSRWKGQLEFIQLMADLRARDIPAVGLIVGGPTPGKDDYQRELKAQIEALNLADRVHMLGHRSDMAELYAVSDVVCNLSQRPEPFGRTVIEALAVGTPVVSYDVGGPAESLAQCLPSGLVPAGEPDALADRVADFLSNPPQPILDSEFTLETQAAKTISIYKQLLAEQGKVVTGVN